MSFTFPHRLNGLRLAEALAAQFEGCGSVKDALRCAAQGGILEYKVTVKANGE